MTILVFQFDYPKATNWLWKELTLRETGATVINTFEGLKIKTENSVHKTARTLVMRNINAKYHDNRSRRLGVMVRLTVKMPTD